MNMAPSRHMVVPSLLSMNDLIPRSQDNTNNSTATKIGDDLPPLYIPPGYGQPGYVPENINVEVGVAMIVLTVLVYILVSLRLYTRACVTKAFGIDDWLIAGATYIMLGGMTVTHLLLVFKMQMGLHTIDFIAEYSVDAIFKGMKLVYIAGIFYSCGMFLLKLSVLCFFRRIIILGKTRTALNILTAIIIFFSLAWIALQIFLCYPPHVFWSSSVSEKAGRCMSAAITNRLIPIGHVITDAAVWIIPIPSILKLQLTWKEKLSTCLLFLIGGSAVVASIVRAIHCNDKEFFTDGTFVTAKVLLFTTLELTLGLICASLFTIKQLISRHWLRGPSSHTMLSDSNAKSLKLENTLSSKTDRELSDISLP